MRDTYFNPDHGSSATLIEFSPKVWCITSIGVQPFPHLRGKGYASALLRRITSHADTLGVILVLSVVADPYPGNLTEEQLDNWYIRNGFRVWTESGGSDAMIRFPNGGPEIHISELPRNWPTP